MEQRIACLICNRRYDSINSTGLKWGDPKNGGEEVTAPANLAAEDGYEQWRDRGHRLYCDKGHLLPEEPHQRPLVVMATFGESQAGKGALARKTESLLSSGELSDQGIHGRLDEHQAVTFRENFPLGKPNLVTVDVDEPRQPYYITVHDTRGGSLNFALFDTGYEDAANRSKLAKVATYLGEVDVFGFVVPPAALPGLPEGVRKSGLPSQDVQTYEGTFNVIEKVVNALRSRRNSTRSRARGAAIYLILSKADRYREYEPFPQDLLVDRPYRGPQQDHGEAMANEQRQLHDFIVAHGGRGLIDYAALVNGKVFLTAVSGIGHDEAGRAPVDAAPNRALDPLVCVLMRAGRGRFGQPA